jgi:RNA 3'-terminal phosphate cyclase (ATP)
MLTIDGSHGEGGGQILRTALALSLLTQTPVRFENVRAGRKKPGLLRQHLACVRAAAQVGDARTDGVALGAQAFTFRPRALRGGDLHVAIGSAGSALLVLQCVLPALLGADAPTTLVLEGGTHNPWAPSFEFLDRSFLPLLRRMGASVDARLIRPGFFPAGGGRVEVEIAPCGRLTPLTLLDRGPIRRVSATALCAALPKRVGVTELSVLRERLGLDRDTAHLRTVPDPRGPGNAAWVEAELDALTAVFVDFGRRGRPAEAVADAAAQAYETWRDRGAPVCEHLADQLLLPLALAGGGAFRTGPLSAHAETNMHTIRRFLAVDIRTETEADGTVTVRLG